MEKQSFNRKNMGILRFGILTRAGGDALNKLKYIKKYDCQSEEKNNVQTLLKNNNSDSRTVAIAFRN